MAQFFPVSSLLLLFVNFHGCLSQDEHVVSHVCRYVRPVQSKAVDVVTFPCPRPDKCDGWWNNLFDEDCNKEQVCQKNVTVVVTRNQTVIECCQGWAQDGDGLCSIPVCGSGCQHDGICEAVGDVPVCRCTLGWEGTYCQIPGANISETCPMSCQNGGLFRRDGDTSSCLCMAGWEGVCCQHDIDECARGEDDCGQLCENQPGGYRCRCLSGHQLLEDGVTCGLVGTTTGSPVPEGSTDEEGTPFTVWFTAVIVSTVGLLCILLVLLCLLIRRRCRTRADKCRMVNNDSGENEYTYDLQIFNTLGGPLYASINKTGRRVQGSEARTQNVEETSSSIAPALPPPLASTVSGEPDHVYEPVGEAVTSGDVHLSDGSYLTPPARCSSRANSGYVNMPNAVDGVANGPVTPDVFEDGIVVLPSEYLTPPGTTPPATLIRDEERFHTLPMVHRSTSIASTHIYEDPSTMEVSIDQGLPDSSQSDVIRTGLPAVHRVYERANTVSSSYASSVSEDNRLTLTSGLEGVYDVPRHPADMPDSDSAGTFVESDPYNDTSCESLDRLDMPDEVNKCGSLHLGEDLGDMTVDNEGIFEPVYAEVDENDSAIYASVSEVATQSDHEDSVPAVEPVDYRVPGSCKRTSAHSDTPTTTSESGYSNSHSLQRLEISDTASLNSYADLNCSNLVIADENEDAVTYSECGTLKPAGNIDLSLSQGDPLSESENMAGEEGIYLNDSTDDLPVLYEPDSVYAECGNVAPHYDVITGQKPGIDLSTDEDYIGPDSTEPVQQIYENNASDPLALYSNHTSVLSVNSSLGPVDGDSDYEYITSPGVGGCNGELTLPSSAPRVLLRQSTLPDNVANWHGGRESDIYVVGDAVHLADSTDNVYGNVSLAGSEELYENTRALTEESEAEQPVDESEERTYDIPKDLAKQSTVFVLSEQDGGESLV